MAFVFPEGVHPGTAAIMLILLAFEMIGSTQLTPYIDSMVADIIGVDQSDHRVALWVCVLVGTYNLSEAACARFWGAMADRIGYRTSFLISISGDMFTTILFGFSRSLGFAFVARLLDGAFCGNTPLAMGWMGACANEENETRFLAWPATAASFGFIIGPLFGSMLTDPAVWAPETFGGTIFESYPYLLPNLAFGMMKLALLIFVVFTLQEPPAPPGNAPRRQTKIGLRSGIPMSPALTRLIVMCSLFTGFITARMQCFVVLGSLPWAVGGLAMNEHNFGALLIISAVAVVLYNMTVYPAVVKRVGLHRAIILASLGCLVMLYVTPLTELTADPAKFGSWRLVPIGTWQVFFPPVATMVVVSGLTLLNREASAAHRAETMGLYQSANALTRGVTIYFAGAIMDFGLMLETTYSFHGGRFVAFYLLSVFCFFNIYTVFEIGMPSMDDVRSGKSGYMTLAAGE